MESTVSVTVTSVANEIDSNKENRPPKEEKKKMMKKKKKNPIPVMMTPSFKKKGNRKTNKKRVPLSDITHLFSNSAHEANGRVASDAVPSYSDSVVLNSNPRKKRTMVAAPGSKTKSLRMGFR